MCTPFLNRLKTINPQAELCVVCQPKHVPLFETHSAVSDVEPIDSFTRCVKRLRAMKFDCGYILPTSFSSAWLFYLAGIPERIGFGAEWRSPLLSSALPLDKRYHYVRRYLSLIGQERDVCVDTPEFFFPSLFLSDTLLRKNSGRLLVGLGIGSQAPARQWPVERFALLSDKLIAELKCDVLLLGGQEETRLVPEFLSIAKRPVIDLIGKTSLENLGYVVSSCALIITNESGLMHAAWALGVPSVIIAGPSNPSLTSPWGNKYKILWHDEIGCVPCIRNECPRKNEGHKECLMKISVNEVFEASSSLLSSIRL